MTPPGAAPPGLRAPGLARRLACLVYEGVLLFGVLASGAYLYAMLTQQRHALQGHAGLQTFLFLLLGVYFVVFWSRGGQTLAMKTWRIRLVDRFGGPVSQARALARYLLSWIWFLPALAAAHVLGLRHALPLAAALGVGVLGYAALTWLRADRQYWHDVACGTRLIAARTGKPERP
jgi:uncharacterized RDD family membrane protein YckC